VVSRLAEGEGRLDAWNARSLTEEPIIRLILDGRSCVRRQEGHVDFLLVALACGRTVKNSAGDKNMGGESEAAWRALLDDLVKRGLKTPELVIVDGAPGLEKALPPCGPMFRPACTVHKHQNLLAHAPNGLHDEMSTTTKT